MIARVASFLAALFLVTGLAAAQDASPLQQSLIEKEKSFLAALQKKDMATLNLDIADDFTAVAVSSDTYDKREMIGFFTYLGLDVSPYDFKVIPVTDTAAIVSYDAVVKIAAQNEEIRIPRYQHMSSLWVKQGDQWKLKFQQATAAIVEY